MCHSPEEVEVEVEDNNYYYYEPDSSTSPPLSLFLHATICRRFVLQQRMGRRPAS